jgi:uncharacterized protein (TIGR03032 family)
MTAPSEPAGGDLELRISDGFEGWLADVGASLVFGIPPARLFAVGLDDSGALAATERTYDKPMGITYDATRDALHVGTRREIWRLQNVLAPGARTDQGCDTLFVPMERSTTGYVNVHDLGVEKDGGVLLVNTRFGCLARTSPTHSFTPTWWPPFLPGPAPNDRCHLNGLAMREGRPYAVTAISTTSEVDSWREHRRDGGVVIDVGTGEVMCGGLSMPHSPRWWDGRLWLANAGTGELGVVEADRGRFEAVAALPGFARGLAFVGSYAVVGTSKPRHGDLYSGLELDRRLASLGWPPRLGVFVVDLRTGDIAEWLQVDGEARELFEVVTLPGVTRPGLLGLGSDDVLTTITFEDVPRVDEVPA